MISVGVGYHALVTDSRKGLCPLPLGIKIPRKNAVQSSTEESNALLTDNRAMSASAVGTVIPCGQHRAVCAIAERARALLVEDRYDSWPGVDQGLTWG